MMLQDSGNVLALADVGTVQKIFEDEFSNLKEVKSWAIVGVPGPKEISHYWPVIDGVILQWSYPYEYVQAALEIIEKLGRDAVFYVSVTQFKPLVIRIEKLFVDTKQKYILIAPRDENIVGAET